MEFDLIELSAASKLLESYNFGFANEILHPIGKVLLYNTSVSRVGNLQVSQLIPDNSEETCCIIIQGDLQVLGTLSNYLHQNGSYQHGVNLVVLGNLEARSLISTNATVFVTNNVILKEVAYLYYDNGTSELRVDETLSAKALIVNDEHRTRIEILNIEHDLDLYHLSLQELAEAIRPEYLGDEDDKVDHAELIGALEAGNSVLV